MNYGVGFAVCSMLIFFGGTTLLMLMQVDSVINVKSDIQAML